MIREGTRILMRLWCCGLLCGGMALADGAEHEDRAQPVYEVELQDVDVSLNGQPPIRSMTVWRTMCGGARALSTEELAEIAAVDEQVFGPMAERRGPRQAQGGGLNINFSFSAAVPQQARDAMEEAALFIESSFADTLTMNISVSWQDLGGGLLGATGSNSSVYSYTFLRDSLQADMDIEDSIQSYLPAGNSLPVRFNDFSTNVTNVGSLRVNWGNIKAIGGTTSSTVASMTFNSTVAWDFNPANGVSGSFWDFQSVVVHEITHAMGFTSGVDNPGDVVEMLDIFRFRLEDGCCDYNPDTVAEFTTAPRLADFNFPNDGHIFDMISVEYAMEDGSPNQASHFMQSVVDGIMQPAQAPGESFWPDFYRLADLDALDAIGWDYPVTLPTTTVPLLDNFPISQIDAQDWSLVLGAAVNAFGANEPTPPLSLDLRGSTAGGDEIRSAFMDVTGLSDLTLQYWWQPGGDAVPPGVGRDLVVEYRNHSGEWIEWNRHLGDGTAATTFEKAVLPLPADAYHDLFRFRFRVTSESSGDDWFVDSICLGTTDQCNCAVSADCDDGIACTVNECTGDGICMYTAEDVLCDDGLECSIDACDVLNGCQYDTSNCSGVFGTVTEDATDEETAAMGLSICHVKVELGIAEDNLLSIGFSDISTDDPAGFYQVPPEMGGADVPPGEVFLQVFPELVRDSYVSIGLLVVPIGVAGCTTLDPDFDAFAFNNSGQVLGGWFCNNPPSGQGNPDADGLVLVGQFTVGAEYTVAGTMTAYINDGIEEYPVAFECAVSCLADLNGDGVVNAADLAILLGSWGPCPGCPGDLNGNGEVDAADLALLLGSWGPC